MVPRGVDATAAKRRRCYGRRSPSTTPKLRCFWPTFTFEAMVYQRTASRDVCCSTRRHEEVSRAQATALEIFKLLDATEKRKPGAEHKLPLAPTPDLRDTRKLL